MDDIDARILRHLAKNGRANMNELGEAVGLSATPTARRLRRLETEGLITGYHAQLDERALGFSLSVFVSVQLDKQVDEALVAFEQAVARFEEVVDCWLMTGDRDYLLRVVTRDLADFERFLTGRLTKVPGVSSLQSSIPIRRVKGLSARLP